MKVKELIEFLKDMNPEAEIVGTLGIVERSEMPDIDKLVTSIRKRITQAGIGPGIEELIKTAGKN